MVTLFLFIAMTVLVLSLNQDWSNVNFKNRNQLVFENRNQNYGAYDIRRSYSRNLGISLIISLTFASLVFLTPYIFGKDLNVNNVEEIFVSTEMFLSKPPVENVEKLMPKEKVELPTTKAKTIQFTEIEVTDEELLNPPPSDKQLDRQNISNQTVDGDSVLVNPNDIINVIEVKKEETPLTFAQEMPRYPEDKLYEDLAKFIVYPEHERNFQIEGTVYVSFVIEKDGTVSNIGIVRGVEGDSGFNKVSIDAVRSLKNFIPAKMNGNSVRLKMTIPIKFSLR